MREKILYVSPIWANIIDYRLNDVVESGMPAFTEPLKHFRASGYKINILWMMEESSSLIFKDSFLASQSRLYVKTRTKLGLIISFFKVFVGTIHQIKKIKPDIVYCHGALSVGAILASVIMRKKTVVRVYGTNKYSSELARIGKITFLLRYPYVFLMFFIPSSLLIATDDGSNADEIYRKIGRSREFYFLKNGYPHILHTTNNRDQNILCVGRIEKKKNQIEALNFFEKVATQNNNLRLIFIGKVSSKSYFEELNKRIEESKFKNQIKIIETITKNELYNFYKNSDANISLQDISNFGNVAIECLASGCLLITYREDIFLELAAYRLHPIAISGSSVKELAMIYTSLDNHTKQKIRESGSVAITSELKSWSERASFEVDIIGGK